MSMVIDCPFCKTRLRIPEGGAGRKVRCPRCSTAVRIPAATTPAADATPRPGPPPRH